MPLVPPTSSSLFRPISHDKPWHTLLSDPAEPASLPASALAHHADLHPSPPPSPPRSCVSSASSSSISVSLDPASPFSPFHATFTSSTTHRPPSDASVPVPHPALHNPASAPLASIPPVVRFTGDSAPVRNLPEVRGRKVTARGARDLGFGSEPHVPSPKPRHHDVMRVRPTAYATPFSPDAPPATAGPAPLEDGLVLRDQHDLLADLHDLSNMLSDHIDVTKGFVTVPREDPPPTAPGFLRRMLRRIRPGRARDRHTATADASSVAAATAAALNREVRLQGGFSDVSEEPHSRLTVQHDVYHADDIRDDCWSESGLRAYNESPHEHPGFSRRNDTDIDAMRVAKGSFLRGRSSRTRADSAWRSRGSRRRSVETLSRPDDSDRALRVCKSSVSVGLNDWENFARGRGKHRLRVKGSDLDRLADRFEVDGRTFDAWKKGKEDVAWGKETIVCATGLENGRDGLTRCEKSFQSSNSSVALSVSSVTQASRTSSIN